MIVEDVRRDRTENAWRLSAAVRTKSARGAGLGGERLHFTVRGDAAERLSEGPECGDAFLAALLMPAMSLGEELVIEAPVSRRLLRSASTVMDICEAWWAELRPIGIAAAPGEVAPGRRPDGVGLFFTTGVDSFFSLLKDGARRAEPGHEPITDLLFADFEQYAGPDYERLLGRIRQVAGQTGCRTIVVDTNIRVLVRPIIPWETYFGAALGSVALALQGLLGRCLLAASDQYGDMTPLGSHPLLDHLWSTERLEVVHDGAEATRTQKVERQLAASPLALETLWVCWLSPPGHNCGTCEKCLRTMVALELTGALDRCRTMPNVLDLDRLRAVSMRSDSACVSMREVARDARERGRHDIAEAAEAAVRRFEDASGPRRVTP